MKGCTIYRAISVTRATAVRRKLLQAHESLIQAEQKGKVYLKGKSVKILDYGGMK